MDNYELQTDASKLEDQGTGAKRENKAGKGRYDLIPPESLYRLAIVYEKGAVVHGDRNWEKGLPIGATISSAIRHLFKYLAGSSDEDHLAQACWNIFSVMWFEKHRPEMQDIPARYGKPNILGSTIDHADTKNVRVLATERGQEYEPERDK